MEQFTNFLQWLDKNNWLNLVYLILAILGIILAFYFYFKTKKEKIPLYAKRSINVISDRLQSLNVEAFYQGEKITNLTVTKVAIWNSGNETIEYSDLAPTDKLRTEVIKECKIFNAEIIHQTTPTNNFNLRIHENSVFIEFDYLDKNQGCIIKVIHSGKKSLDLNVSGTFKGVGEIKNLKATGIIFFNFLSIINSPLKRTGSQDIRKTAKSISWFTIIVGLFLFTLYFLKISDENNIPLLVLGSIYLLFGLAMLFLFSISSLPKDFTKFYDDE